MFPADGFRWSWSCQFLTLILAEMERPWSLHSQLEFGSNATFPFLVHTGSVVVSIDPEDGLKYWTGNLLYKTIHERSVRGEPVSTSP